MSAFTVTSIFIPLSMVGKILKLQNHLKLVGNPKGMRFESGEVLHMNERICENLKDESHVWVVLKGCELFQKNKYFNYF